MPSTTPYKRGDVVLVPFPFTDLTSSKRRPALVISPDSFNAQQQDLVVAAITSQVPDITEPLVLTSKDFSSGTLPKISLVKPNKLFTFIPRW
jgi:mRNA interferase MazF